MFVLFYELGLFETVLGLFGTKFQLAPFKAGDSFAKIIGGVPNNPKCNFRVFKGRQVTIFYCFSFMNMVRTYIRKYTNTRNGNAYLPYQNYYYYYGCCSEYLIVLT